MNCQLTALSALSIITSGMATPGKQSMWDRSAIITIRWRVILLPQPLRTREDISIIRRKLTDEKYRREATVSKTIFTGCFVLEFDERT